MQFNPYEARSNFSPSQISGNPELIRQMTQTTDSLSDVAKLLGQGQAEQGVRELMASGKLKDMNEQEAIQALASKGEVGKQAQDNINSLIGRKSAERLAGAKLKEADVLNRNKVEAAKQSNLNALGLQAKRDASAMSRTKEQTAQQNANRMNTEMFQKSENQKNRNLEMLLAGDKSKFKADPDALRKVTEQHGGIPGMMDKAFKDLENDNTFFDVDYNKDSKDRISGAVQSTMLNDKYLNEQFRLNPSAYTKMVIETMGSTDVGYSPTKIPFTTIGEDDWTPDMSSDRVLDLKKKLKALEGK